MGHLHGLPSLHLQKQLHWLPIKRRIGCKEIATLSFRPKPYETSLYHLTSSSKQSFPYAPTRALRSSASKLLPRTVTYQPPVWLNYFGSHTFRVSAPTLWNSLLHGVRFCESITTIWQHLIIIIIFKRHSLPPPRPSNINNLLYFLIDFLILISSFNIEAVFTIRNIRLFKCSN